MHDGDFLAPDAISIQQAAIAAERNRLPGAVARFEVILDLIPVGEPVDQAWGWREFALKDPNGYVWSIYQDKSGGQWT